MSFVKNFEATDLEWGSCFWAIVVLQVFRCRTVKSLQNVRRLFPEGREA